MAGRFKFECGDVKLSIAQTRDYGGLASTTEATDTDVDRTGDLVWPTAVIFCRYLCDHADLIKGRKLMDLGAGTGLVGLTAACLGARVTLTDVPRVLPLLEGNVSDFQRERSDAEAVAGSLWWGEESELKRWSEERGPFDVVLCCEVVYQQPSVVLDALRATLTSLLAKPSGIVIFAYQQRDGGEITDAEFFSKLTSENDFELVEEVSMAQWDDCWDDTACRWIRIYRWKSDSSTAS